MLQMIDEIKLAEEFTALQRSLLNALRQDADMKIRLGDYLNISELNAAVGEYIHLIEQAR